jgi:hypothetical protein
MKIKKQYEINDKAWIHLGGPRLSEGKVIDIFDLEHAGYSKDQEFYIIELQTGIDPILEVRSWEQMSQDAKGPIGAYRRLRDEIETKKALGKVGIQLPIEVDTSDPLDPTPEEIHAAIERAELAKKDMYRVPSSKPKRFYKKRTAKKQPE